MRQFKPSWLLLMAGFATTAFAVAFHFRWFPLGVPGELEAPRLGTWDVPITPWLAMLPAVAAAGAMAAFVYWALGWIESARRRSFVLALVGCILLGGMFQLFLEIAAPNGLQKWAVLYHSFRLAARVKFNDVPAVWRHHAEIVSAMEPNHVSANPAGWVVVYRVLLSFFDSHPQAARWIWKIEPGEIAWALRMHSGNIGTPMADQATITVMAFASRLIALAVGLPIGWLVAQRCGRSAALAACAVAMLIPASPLVAPAVDTVYPTFATLILALSYHASEHRSWGAAAAAGVLVGVGMLFSLCFVVVAALCALMVAMRVLEGHRPTVVSMAAAGLGWLVVAVVMALLFQYRVWESWRINLAKNHEFNLFCGCSYWTWLGVNLLELIVAMGIPLTVFLIARALGALGHGWPSGGGDALFAAWLIVIALLDLMGTNRGEVSRLWLFLMPIGAALAVEWLDVASRVGRRIAIGLLMLQAFQCSLLSREVLLLWMIVPRQIQEEYLPSQDGKWAAYRRLSDGEFQRRQRQK